MFSSLVLLDFLVVFFFFFLFLSVTAHRHECYNQYRAMFVRNCKVILNRHVKPSWTEQEGGEEEVYLPVLCAECNTEVGVRDSDDVYHFYHVLASAV